MGLIDKFYNPSKRVIGALERQVREISDFEKEVSNLSGEELKQKTTEFRNRIKDRESEISEDEILEQIAPEAFAVLREAMKRVWGERHFDVQIIGGLVLHQGKIAEMKTGEGKTIVATLPLYLNSLAGRGAHLVTVNDYLSKHQGEGMGQVFDFLGLSTGIIQSNQETYRFKKSHDYKHYSECEGLNLEPCSRRDAYHADITYGTNNEFGFDYLRDNMAPNLELCVQRELYFAIVDEVDSILIDEARTPLIISAPAEESGGMYQQFAALVPRLTETDDYVIDEKEKTVTLTDKGIHEMEKMLHIDNIYEVGGITMVHHLEQALKAHALFQKDRDYVVQDGEIMIVDEFTGRLMVGRRYSEGLHQAIEAKENVEVKNESQTLATISFQNLFRMYKKLSGMTGTAATEAEEFFKIYKLDVVEIPTNKPVARLDVPDRIYKTEEAKITAITEDVRIRHDKGQPILIGTVSVSKNEILSKALKRAGIKHEVLNAKNHEREAKIISKAGLVGAVTVATNMAGRGTDIKLGEGVRELGGLHVLGTERHEARRIDNQLRGRSGRQGDAGSSQFFVSMDDDLMRIFGGDRLKNIMNSLGLPDEMPIENRMISNSIESAQKRVEGYNFDIRKHLVEYDDVMNKHREVIYRKRRRVLESESKSIRQEEDGKSEVRSQDSEARSQDSEARSQESEVRSEEEEFSLKDEILEILEEEIEKICNLYIEDQDKLRMELKAIFGEIILPSLDIVELKQFVRKIYDDREQKYGSNVTREVEKMVYLRTIDMLWIEHLTTMDELRTGIGLQGYGQRDPLVEYKQEAYRLFEALLQNIEAMVARTIFKIEIKINNQAPKPVSEESKPLLYSEPVVDKVGGFDKEKEDLAMAQKMMAESNTNRADSESVMLSQKKTVFDRMKESAATGPASQVKHVAKPGRNDPCPCGSGKKYKKCCGK
ncbi:MAG: preprotein translocase subunit SecA [Candidatus Berkelbacteria bacterium]|nr:preprotein translocase subunit SecA [Candidatus Berkelbacteria bacterium]